MANKRGFLKLTGRSSKKLTIVIKVDNAGNAQVSGAAGEENPKTKPIRGGNKDFSSAASSGKLIRNSVQSMLILIRDSSMVSRLVKLTYKIIKLDLTNPVGERNITKGPLELLRSFNFNNASKFNSIVTTPIDQVINWETGVVILNLLQMFPNHDIRAPYGATHFQLFSAACEIDFTNGTFKSDLQQSDLIPCEETGLRAISLVHTITANSILPLITTMGIRFYNEFNGAMRLLDLRNNIAVSIVDVNKL